MTGSGDIARRGDVNFLGFGATYDFGRQFQCLRESLWDEKLHEIDPLLDPQQSKLESL
jgi:hypothetical protein